MATSADLVVCSWLMERGLWVSALDGDNDVAWGGSCLAAVVLGASACVVVGVLGAGVCVVAGVLGALVCVVGGVLGAGVCVVAV